MLENNLGNPVLELVRIVEDWESLGGGCDCCTDTYYYYVTPDGSRFADKVDALVYLLEQKGVKVEFD